MSDNYVRLIPTDPQFVPDLLAQRQAIALLTSLLPYGEKIHVRVTDHVVFVDPGGNFERVSCPACALPLDISWWSSAMDLQTNFAELLVTVPCCHATISLNALQYHWPAGFARFVLEVLNPARDLSDAELQLVSRCLDTPLTRVLAHY